MKSKTTVCFLCAKFHSFGASHCNQWALCSIVILCNKRWWRGCFQITLEFPVSIVIEDFQKVWIYAACLCSFGCLIPLPRSSWYCSFVKWKIDAI